jgi:hypothetical protein
MRVGSSPDLSAAMRFMTLYDRFRPSRDSGGYRGPAAAHTYRGTNRRRAETRNARASLRRRREDSAEPAQGRADIERFRRSTISLPAIFGVAVGHDGEDCCHTFRPPTGSATARPGSYYHREHTKNRSNCVQSSFDRGRTHAGRVYCGCPVDRVKMKEKSNAQIPGDLRPQRDRQ